MPNLTESQLALAAEIKQQQEEIKRYVLEIMALSKPGAITALTGLICELVLDIAWQTPNSADRVLKVMEGDLMLKRIISELLAAMIAYREPELANGYETGEPYKCDCGCHYEEAISVLVCRANNHKS